MVDVHVDDIVLDAFDVVEGAARGIKVFRPNDGVLIAPAGATQYSNGVVTVVVSRWLTDTG